jgi:hypothetical protein
MVSSLFNIINNLDPNSSASQQVNAASGSIHARDLQLKLQARRLQSERKVVSEEIKRLSQSISQSIEKYFGNIYSTEKSHIDEKELAEQEQQQNLDEKELASQEQQQSLDEKELVHHLYLQISSCIY